MGMVAHTTSRGCRGQPAAATTAIAAAGSVLVWCRKMRCRLFPGGEMSCRRCTSSWTCLKWKKNGLKFSFSEKATKIYGFDIYLVNVKTIKKESKCRVVVVLAPVWNERKMAYNQMIKSRYCEKATKFEKNIPPVLTKQLFLPSNVITSGQFFQILLPFQRIWTLQTHLLLQTFTIFSFFQFLQSFLSNYRTRDWSSNFSLSSACM